MKIKTILIIGILFFYGCNNDINNKIKPKIIEIKTNERLIGYKTIEKGESEDDIFKGKPNFNIDKVNVRYVDELIIIKTYRKVNDCAKYIMDINIQNDTIILKYDLVS